MENSASSRFQININPANWRVKELLIFLFVILFIGALSFVLTSRTSKPTSPIKPPPPEPPIPVSISPHTLVYGYWEGNSSFIKAYDLSSGNTYPLAQLPSNVKRVTVISPTELLFINNTDARDHGTEIAIYSIADKTTRTVFRSDQDFGIDDYFISPNRRYLADWEVSFLPDSQVVRGGKSRVYAVDLANPTTKRLVYDEVSSATSVVHDPRGVTNEGEVFMDSFLPNSGRGWAHGMSVYSIATGRLEDIPSMQDGTYSTQPYPSPDSAYLGFAGYDGSSGAGRNIFSGSINRTSVMNPNRIEILETKSRQRKLVPVVQNATVNPTVWWDRVAGNLIFSATPRGTNTAQVYSYNPNTNSMQSVSIGQSGTTDREMFVSSLADNKILLATPDRNLSATGNLGDGYFPSITNFSVFDQKTSQTTPLALLNTYVQFIDIVPSSFFQYSELTPQAVVGATKDVLQLQTFALKPALAQARLEQQSSPPETDVPPIDLGVSQIQDPTPVPPECNGCHCPLYLYGPAGLNVEVTVNTPISSPAPAYTNTNGYNATLLSGGKMSVGGKTYEKIEFDFQPAQTITPPTQGIIATGETLASTLTFFAKNLGLNQKETNDLIVYATAKITSPYVFVSFFDEKTSKAILPLSFNPQPDTYINIIFYLKPLQVLPTIFPTTPQFEAIPKRSNFTAVEVSAIVSR